MTEHTHLENKRNTTPHPHHQDKYDSLLPIRGVIITVSDSCSRGEATDTSGPLAKQLLKKYGVDVHSIQIVPDGIQSVRAAIKSAITQGAKLIFTTGGTGITQRDLTPEATEPLLELRLDAIAMQISQVGLRNTPSAVLSRGLVGITQRGPDGVIILNAPGSQGGVRDAVSVIGPLLPHLTEQLISTK